MSTREPLTALDGIAILLTICAAGWLVSFGLMGSAFAAMYADFGDTHIPWLTRVVTQPYVPPLLALPSIALLVASASVRSIGPRRLTIVSAFGLALVGLAVCYVGVYMPSWQLADAIRAE